jgi:thymidine kinase
MARLELILGCMYSGKSSELIRRIRMQRVLNNNILIIKHALDKRYENEDAHIISHDFTKEYAIETSTLTDILTIQEYKDAEIIFIDEGQFFSDIISFVLRAVETDQKSVVISALDGNYKREPYIHIMQLIPLADDVVRLNALCAVCKDGTKAQFSKYIKNNTIDIESKNGLLVGGHDIYMSVCRHHYLQPLHIL